MNHGKHWHESESHSARWSSEVEKAIQPKTVYWEDTCIDYQGHAKAFGITNDNKPFFVEWTYGSCGGCDSYEDMDEAAVVQAMKEAAIVFDDLDEVYGWAKQVSGDYYPGLKEAVESCMSGHEIAEFVRKEHDPL